MYKNIVELGRPQIAIWRMRIACWIPKATNTHSQYVILVASPLQQRFQERASMLRYTYIVLYSLGFVYSDSSGNCHTRFILTVGPAMLLLPFAFYRPMFPGISLHFALARGMTPAERSNLTECCLPHLKATYKLQINRHRRHIIIIIIIRYVQSHSRHSLLFRVMTRDDK